MHLLAGLGNPGQKYSATRHNIGFTALDRFIENHHFDKKDFRKKHHGLLLEENWHGEKLLLLKPLTYMNNSGQSVRAVTDYFNIRPEQVTVILDDVSLPFGSMKLKPRGSDGGHNGLKSVAAHLGPVYNRLRLGIACQNQRPLRDYVLGSFSSEEKAGMERFLNGAAAAITTLLDEGIDKAMSLFNNKNFAGDETP